MPDDVVYGRMHLVRKKLTDAETSLAEREKVFKLAEVDCFPPPGSTTTYVRPDDIAPNVFQLTLQDAEKDHIRDLCRDKDPSLSDTDKAIGAVLGQLGFYSLQIGYLAKSYKDLFAVAQCFTMRIYLRVKFDVYEVKITAAEQVTIGSTTFPKDDELATFRVGQPVKWRFEGRPKWNPECCPDEAGRPTNDIIGEWLPLDLPGVKFEWDIWKKKE
jgi:hypothetical protein